MTASERALPIEGRQVRLTNRRSALLAIGTLGGINIVATATFFFTRWGAAPLTAERERLPVVLYLLAVAVIIGLGIAAQSWRHPALCISVALLSATVAIGLMEIMLEAFPSIIPDRVLIHNAALMRQARGLRTEDAEQLLEKLPESPWVKFRPNVRARSIGYRGDDFAAEWVTDGLGFKNDSAVASLREVAAIAVGDSFVEAMGVPTTQQWTTLVSRAGFPVYSMGVQGYAPQQAVGALRKFGPLFKTRFVLFGFTPGFEERTGRFAGGAAPKRYEGGIESVNRYLREVRDVEYRVFPVTNAILSAAKIEVGSLLARRRSSGSHPVLRYRDEVDSDAAASFDPGSADWQRTLDAIREAKDISESLGARLAVVLFTRRALAYYQHVNGGPPPETHYEAQLARAIEQFCRQESLGFISTRGDFERYVNEIWRPGLEPPFFFDGHPNRVGQGLIADTVLAAFGTGTGARGVQR
jgi:hypothetical protein